MAKRRAWYIRFRFPVIAVLLLAAGFRVYTFRAKENLFAGRIEVTQAERERLARVYEEKMRDKFLHPQALSAEQESNQVGIEKKNAEAARQVDEPALLYVSLGNGATIRLRMRRKALGSRLLAMARILTGKCLLPASRGPAPADCAGQLSTDEDFLQLAAHCSSATRVLLSEGHSINFSHPKSQHVLHVDPSDAMGIVNSSGGAADEIADVLDVLWAKCEASASDPAPAWMRVTKVYVLARDGQL